MGWPGFQHGPKAPNTVRNTDGLWLIHGGASRDTNNLLQDVAPLFPIDLLCTFMALQSCLIPVRADRDVKAQKKKTLGVEAKVLSAGKLILQLM